MYRFIFLYHLFTNIRFYYFPTDFLIYICIYININIITIKLNPLVSF